MTTEVEISTPPLRLHNTLTRAKEVFRPQDPKKVRLYTCGPTVYDFAHIGNFRTYVFEDILRRTLGYFGYGVLHVMNITDVDDKTIRGAIAKSVSLDDYTEPYKNAFFEDVETLGLLPAHHYPAATEYISEMIEMIQTLIDKGVAYPGRDGSVYFAISKFPNYGCLSHLKLDELQSGASDRVSSDEYDKDNVSDFVLWKAYDDERDGQVFWESPWGKGRPGWHLECSVMAMQLLGDSLDIHCGGVDNIFPHHENEIAQSEACSGTKFSGLWMHSEHLVVDNKKMSKSLGNFYTLRNLLDKGFNGDQVRYLLMQTHYKTKLNFTLDGLEGAKVALQRLNDFLARMRGIEGDEATGKADQVVHAAAVDFAGALADDLNMSAALATIFDMVREINLLADQKAIGKPDAQAVIERMRRFNEVLAVLDIEGQSLDIPEDIQQALVERNEARANKNWAEADRLRDVIANAGFTIEDSSSGATLKRR